MGMLAFFTPFHSMCFCTDVTSFEWGRCRPAWLSWYAHMVLRVGSFVILSDSFLGDYSTLMLQRSPRGSLRLLLFRGGKLKFNLLFLSSLAIFWRLLVLFCANKPLLHDPYPSLRRGTRVGPLYVRLGSFGAFC